MISSCSSRRSVRRPRRICCRRPASPRSTIRRRRSSSARTCRSAPAATPPTGGTTRPSRRSSGKDVGLTLRIIPRVHEGDVVRLDVSQEVSSLCDAVTGAADLVTNRRSIQTTVLADDSQTIVLGGLISDDRMNSKSQVPVLGDIPVIGNPSRAASSSRPSAPCSSSCAPRSCATRRTGEPSPPPKYARVRSAEAPRTIAPACSSIRPRRG
jgi:general secretion pathway protein D